MIKALWIDDEPNEEFVDSAYNQDIDIEFRTNVDDGIVALMDKTNNFDVIILDANCKSHSDGEYQPKISALGYALKRITEERIELPWFVYSGGGFSGEESINAIVEPYEREYDDKEWYRKPKEMFELFSKIKSVIPNTSSFKIKTKYKDVFSWYPNQTELIEIIQFVEENKFNNQDVFNKIRKELDWVMPYLYDHGYLLEPFTGSNLGECSQFLGNRALLNDKIIPEYIQRSFHTVVSLSNEGSHRMDTEYLVKSGSAPYLVRSIVYELLNILHWMKTIPTVQEDIENKRYEVAKSYYTQNNFKIEQDEDGVCHCKQCVLNSIYARKYIGKRVALNYFQKNDSQTSCEYPYYAEFDEI